MTLSNLPANRDIYVDHTGGSERVYSEHVLQTFHMNLWRQHWIKDFPLPHAEEVTVTNFQYQPL